MVDGVHYLFIYLFFRFSTGCSSAAANDPPAMIPSCILLAAARSRLCRLLSVSDFFLPWRLFSSQPLHHFLPKANSTSEHVTNILKEEEIFKWHMKR